MKSKRRRTTWTRYRYKGRKQFQMDRIKDRYPDEWNGRAPVCDRQRQKGKIYFFTEAKIDDRYPDEWNGNIPVENAEINGYPCKEDKKKEPDDRFGDAGND